MEIGIMNRTSRSILRTSATTFSRANATSLAALVLLGISLSTQVALAGKPLPPPPPPPPAVYYDVNELGFGSANSMNEVGIIVGNDNGHAFRYDLLSGGVNLNNLAATWIDLAVSPSQTATGWIANRADGINNSGVIVGRAKHVSGATRLYQFDRSVNQFKLLPGPQSTIPSDGSTSYFGARINDSGIICSAAGVGMFVYTPTVEGSYTWENLWDTFGISIPARQVAINNAGTIVGWYTSGTGSSTIWTAFRITPAINGYTFPPEQFPGYRFRNVSNGWICGDRQAVYQGRKVTQAGGAMRLPDYGTANSIQLLTGGWAADVNDIGDACINDGILSMGGGATLQIDQLIAPASKGFWDALPSKHLTAITNRDLTTGFGYISCYSADFSTTTPVYRCILLTPRKP